MPPDRGGRDGLGHRRCPRSPIGHPGRGPESVPVPAPAGNPTAPVYVMSLTGVVDNVMAGYVEELVKRAGDEASPALIITINTPGGSLDATQRIVSSLLEAPVPTIV